VPINSDFDLYSVGRDGQSAPALTAKVSQDDIVRANNGGFVGLASDY
jgi:general secretion pathway protein G